MSRQEYLVYIITRGVTKQATLTDQAEFYATLSRK